MTEKKSDEATEIREIPNEETIRAIEEAERGEGLSRTFHSVEEVMEALNAPD